MLSDNRLPVGHNPLLYKGMADFIYSADSNRLWRKAIEGKYFAKSTDFP